MICMFLFGWDDRVEGIDCYVLEFILWMGVIVVCERIYLCICFGIWIRYIFSFFFLKFCDVIWCRDVVVGVFCNGCF